LAQAVDLRNAVEAWAWIMVILVVGVGPSLEAVDQGWSFGDGLLVVVMGSGDDFFDWE
jgi:hypothetical protein